jgi:hypothetical protein
LGGVGEEGKGHALPFLCSSTIVHGRGLRADPHGSNKCRLGRLQFLPAHDCQVKELGLLSSHITYEMARLSTTDRVVYLLGSEC